MVSLPYNTRRLHSAIVYVAPYDKLKGNDKQLFSERDRKLAETREKRKNNRRKMKHIFKEQPCLKSLASSALA